MIATQLLKKRYLCFIDIGYLVDKFYRQPSQKLNSDKTDLKYRTNYCSICVNRYRYHQTFRNSNLFSNIKKNSLPATKETSKMTLRREKWALVRLKYLNSVAFHGGDFKVLRPKLYVYQCPINLKK